MSNELRERLIERLNADEHAPMSTHNPETGACTQCPWPLHVLPPEAIADAILPIVEAVWEEGRASAFTDFLRPLRDDMTRESTPNPYREQEDV